MADKIILAEDTVALRDALAELLVSEGFEVVAVGDGVAAEAAAAAGAQLLILDLLLPKKQGMQVAESLRNVSNKIPIVMMTGVLKTTAQAKDAKDRLGVKDYLIKPLEGEVFMAAVNAALGRAASPVVQQATVPADPMPAKGSNAEFPPALLMFRAQHERQSGVLDLGNAQERARIFFYKGALVMAQSSREGRHLGAEMVRAGELAPNALALAIQSMGTDHAGLYKVMLNMDLVDEARAKEAYKRLVPSILQDCVSMSGRFRWTATEAFVRLIPAINAPVLPALFEGIKATKAEAAEKLLEGRKQHRVSRGPNFDRFNQALESNFGPECSRAINGRARLMQIIEAAATPEARRQRLVQMFALLATQSAVTEAAGATTTSTSFPAAAPVADPQPTPTPGPMPAVAAPQAPRAAVTDPSVTPGPMPAAQAPRSSSGSRMPAVAAPGTPPNAGGPSRGTSPGMPAAPSAPAASAPPAPAGPLPLPQGVSAEVAATLRDAESRVGAMLTQNHYEVLGVPQDADVGTIKKAFFALAARFHPDKFSGLNLGEFKGRLDAVFARLNEANDILTKIDRKANYDLELAAKASGKQTDISAIFEAESSFTKAENVMLRGDMAAAKKLLDRAVEMDPQDLYKAYQCYATFCSQGRPKARAPEVIAELEGFAKTSAIPRVNEFLGHVAKAGEMWKEAKVYWKRVSEEPQGNKPLAQRELQLIQQKMDEAKPGDKGLLGKLFKN